MSKIVILGAGPCGLGAAYHLNKLGHNNWQIYEKNQYVGGLAASFTDDRGFTWDVGGHVLFSHYNYFDLAVADALGAAYYEHQRESWIRILKTFVPYPFQNNIRHLPEYALQECVEGLKELRETPCQSSNFREWMNAVFGYGIVKYFMEPYNSKVWGIPLETMSKDWIAERVSLVDLDRIERNINEQRDDLSWGPNNTFRFPRHGGTGAIYEGICKPFSDRIHFDHAMLGIDTVRKQVSFCNGSQESYDILINTTPLDMLVKASTGLPDLVREASDTLVHNSGLIVGLGFEGSLDSSRCWIYFPEPDCPFYRVTNFHNYSRYNVPDGAVDRYFSLMCETTCSTHSPQNKNDIADRTIQGLLKSGIIKESDTGRMTSSYLIDIPYSYPVPTLLRDSALKIIQPFLEGNSIYSRGRFGAWKYEVGNMDHSFMQGVELVERLIKGVPEKTITGNTA